LLALDAEKRTELALLWTAFSCCALDVCHTAASTPEPDPRSSVPDLKEYHVQLR
jgi:hypothetical protein